MSDNFWLGDNELIIVANGGTYSVLEKYEDYTIVFTDTYDECREYCEKARIKYEKSIVG